MVKGNVHVSFCTFHIAVAITIQMMEYALSITSDMLRSFAKLLAFFHFSFPGDTCVKHLAVADFGMPPHDCSAFLWIGAAEG